MKNKKEFAQKIDFNLAGFSLNGVLISNEDSQKAIENLLELRAQVTSMIDILEEMNPEKDKTDIIPYYDTKTLSSDPYAKPDFVDTVKKKETPKTIKGSFEITTSAEKKEKKVEKGKSDLSSLRSFKAEGGANEGFTKTTFYILNGVQGKKLIDVKNSLTFKEKIADEFLNTKNVLQTKVFKNADGKEYILLSVLSNLLNVNYNFLTTVANENNADIAIAVFTDTNDRESSRKLIDVKTALHIIKEYNIEIVLEDIDFKGYLNLNRFLDMSKAISKANHMENYFNAKKSLIYIMNNCKYPWYFINHCNKMISNSWDAYLKHKDSISFETKKSHFNNFIDVALSSFTNRFTKAVRDDADFNRELVVVYDDALNNYYTSSSTKKETVFTLVDYVNNKLDTIIENSYKLKNIEYKPKEVAQMCDRSVSWVYKAAEYLGYDSFSMDAVKEIMQLSTKSLNTVGYKE